MNQLLYMTDEAVSKAFGIPFSLFGFASVFGVLLIIMIVIIIFGKVFGTTVEKPAKQSVAAPKKEVAVESTPVNQPVEAVPVTNDTAIVAAIVAAISSYRSSNGENGGFRVVSFKKRK